MGWSIIQNQNSRFLNILSKIMEGTNQKIRIDILLAFIGQGKIIRTENTEQIDFPVS